MTTAPVAPAAAAASDVRRAWYSMLLAPVAFVLAFLVGEGLVSLLGYELDPRPPLWAILTASTPAFLVMLVPPVVSSVFARRAAAQGRRDGWVPAGLLIALSVGFVLTNFLALLVD
ncbi:MAG: hypothetical protein LT071_01920 [Nocardioides sp.]|nr:hypothetical protein [Nocardioides sp.]